MLRSRGGWNNKLGKTYTSSQSATYQLRYPLCPSSVDETDAGW